MIFFIVHKLGMDGKIDEEYIRSLTWINYSGRPGKSNECVCE